MNLQCNPELAAGKTSESQRTKLITEGWFTAEGYCLNCTSSRLVPTSSSTPFRDHTCPHCGHGYEMKSGRKRHTDTVQDGGYDSMMREILGKNLPALMLLQYTPEWRVQRLLAIHPTFMTPKIVRRRKTPHTRPRSEKKYWMCNLDLSIVPPDAKIVVVDGAVRPKATVREEFQRLNRFKELKAEERGWTGLVLAKIRKLEKIHFTSKDLYALEGEMHAVYPENSHIKDKIRQQLQVLRDLGYLEFVRRGEYRMLL